MKARLEYLAGWWWDLGHEPDGGPSKFWSWRVFRFYLYAPVMFPMVIAVYLISLTVDE